MLRRARHQAARSGAARGHRPHDGDAAPPAARRRHARALQRHGRDRARRACHRAGLRREPSRHGRRRAALRLRAPRARRHGRRSSMPAPPRRWSWPGSRLRRLPVLRDEHRAASCCSSTAACRARREARAARVARATASHNTLCLGEQSSAKLMRDARLERVIGAPPLAPSRPRHVRGAARRGRRHRARGLARRLRRALRPHPHAHAHARCAGARLEGCDRLDRRQGRRALRLGRAVRHPFPPASGRRGARRAVAGDSPSCRARQRRALAPDGRRARPCRSRRASTSPMPPGARRTARWCCGRSAMAQPRSAGCSSASAGQPGSRRTQARASAAARRAPGRDRSPASSRGRQ